MAKETSFPVLPKGIEITRRVIRAGRVYEATSGKEERVVPWNANRYEFMLTFPVLQTALSAPAPYGSDSEVGALIRAYDDASGVLLTYTFTDPYDGTSRNVRFVQDSLSLLKAVSGVWKASLRIRTVSELAQARHPLPRTLPFGLP